MSWCSYNEFLSSCVEANHYGALELPFQLNLMINLQGIVATISATCIE